MFTDMKPVEKFLVKTYISKLKPPTLRICTNQQGFKKFAEAYKYALKTALAFNDVGS